MNELTTIAESDVISYFESRNRGIRDVTASLFTHKYIVAFRITVEDLKTYPIELIEAESISIKALWNSVIISAVIKEEEMINLISK